MTNKFHHSSTHVIVARCLSPASPPRSTVGTSQEIGRTLPLRMVLIVLFAVMLLPRFGWTQDGILRIQERDFVFSFPSEPMNDLSDLSTAVFADHVEYDFEAYGVQTKSDPFLLPESANPLFHELEYSTSATFDIDPSTEFNAGHYNFKIGLQRRSNNTTDFDDVSGLGGLGEGALPGVTYTGSGGAFGPSSPAPFVDGTNEFRIAGELRHEFDGVYRDYSAPYQLPEPKGVHAGEISGTLRLYYEDAAAGPETANFNRLKEFILWTGGLMRRANPPEIPQIIGTIGIRADAVDAIRQDLLNNPTPQFGNVGIWIETGSPQYVSAPVQIPDDPFTFSFDYAFLEDGGTLKVLLGDSELLRRNANPASRGVLQTASVQINRPAGLVTNLTFLIDGLQSQQSVVITNVEFPGLDMLNLDQQWKIYGEGNGDFAYIASPEQLEQLAATLVPEPGSGLLAIAGLLGIGCTARFRRHT